MDHLLSIYFVNLLPINVPVPIRHTYEYTYEYDIE